MVGRRAVAVAGTHGKTTTTSMLTVALQHCGADPSFAIGGNLNESGANAHNGSGDVFVAEADESDGSFLLLRADRGDRHQRRGRPPRPLRHPGGRRRGLRDVRRRGSSPGGFLVICADDAGCRARSPSAAARRAASTCAPTARRRTPTCGWSDVRTRGHGQLASTAVAPRPSARPGASCGCPGRHNALNAAAALAAGSGSGCPAERLREGLAAFTGTRRRFELKGTAAASGSIDRLRPPPDRDRRRPARRPRRWPATAGWSSCSSRTCYSRTAAVRGRSSAPRSGWPTRSSCMEVYAAARGPGARRHRRARRRGRAAAAGAGGLRAVLVGGRRRAGRRARPGDVVLTSGPATSR